jgi:hypothetical protein
VPRIQPNRVSGLAQLPGHPLRPRPVSTGMTDEEILPVPAMHPASGRSSAQGAVQPGAVVPGDVLHDCVTGHDPGGQGLSVDECALTRHGTTSRGQAVPATLGYSENNHEHAEVAAPGIPGPSTAAAIRPLTCW